LDRISLDKRIEVEGGAGVEEERQGGEVDTQDLEGQRLSMDGI